MLRLARRNTLIQSYHYIQESNLLNSYRYKTPWISRNIISNKFSLLSDTRNELDDKASKIDPESTLLYVGDQSLWIKGFFGLGSFNALYWGINIADLLIHGVPTPPADFPLEGPFSSLALSNPLWDYVGVAGTGLIYYMTYEMAKTSVYTCELSKDKRSFLVQLYNILGSKGERLNIPVGDVKLIDLAGTWLLGNKNSYIPVSVTNRKRRLVFSKSGSYHDPDTLYKLLSPSHVLDDKQTRINWLRESKSRRKK